MAYDLKQFYHLVARVTSEQALYSKAAVHLLLGTAAKESDFGVYFRQIGGGPARGPFGMELATEKDIWVNYLWMGRPEKARMVTQLSQVSSYDNNGALEGNVIYAICMARLHYRRVFEPFPNPYDIAGMGRYWDVHWNKNPEKGTVKQFIEKWDQFIGRRTYKI